MPDTDGGALVRCDIENYRPNDFFALARVAAVTVLPIGSISNEFRDRIQHSISFNTKLGDQ